jgi:alcohol dehydrogenase
VPSSPHHLAETLENPRVLCPRCTAEAVGYKEVELEGIKMEKTMVAARLHALGTPMSLDTIPIPTPRPNDVLVRVKACGIVPNMANVINNWPKWFPHQPLPKFPAIFGLDPAGVVAEVGEAVLNVKPGDRVYVSPLRSCGSCKACRSGYRSHCRYFTLNGYFSTSRDGQRIFDLYPYGGFSEYMTAPDYAIVNIPDNLTFEQAGRFGYLGTSYGALKNAGAGSGQVAFIDGITGTLGVAATVLGLAMGLSRILGTGRDEGLLSRVKAIAPDRIEVMKLGSGSSGEWAKSFTGGEGVDFVISALGAKAPASTMLDSMKGVRRGGKVVNVGGVAEDLPIDVKWLMDEQVQLIGSNWFTGAQGQEMAEMVRTGAIDLSYLQHKIFPLARVNEAISDLMDRDGGFSNYIVAP